MRLFVELGNKHIKYFKPQDEISNVGILLEGLPKRLNPQLEDPATGQRRIGNMEHIYGKLPMFGIHPYLDGFIQVKVDSLLIRGRKETSALRKVTFQEILERNGLPIIYELDKPEPQIRKLLIDAIPLTYEQNLANIITSYPTIPSH